MNKWNMAILAIFALLAAAGITGSRTTGDDAAMKCWQKLESTYSQRIDLLDQVIRHAQGVDVIAAELNALSDSLKSAKTSTTCFSANPEEIKAFMEKQEKLTAAIAQLVVSENIYPKLLSNPEFRGLHDKLEAVESQLTALTENFNRALHENSLSRNSSIYKLAELLNFDTEPYSPVSMKEENAAIVLNHRSKTAGEFRSDSQGVSIATN